MRIMHLEQETQTQTLQEVVKNYSPKKITNYLKTKDEKTYLPTLQHLAVILTESQKYQEANEVVGIIATQYYTNEKREEPFEQKEDDQHILGKWIEKMSHMIHTYQEFDINNLPVHKRAI